MTPVASGGAGPPDLETLRHVTALQHKTAMQMIGAAVDASQAVTGVFCAAVAFVFRYFSIFTDGALLVAQAQIENASAGSETAEAETWVGRWKVFGLIAAAGAILFGAASLAAFIYGGIKAAHSVW